MQEFLSKIAIKVNDKTYLKDPESSELGKKIISGSIDLIDKIGFECYNFRKLAQEIASTEASVYRYFENKHQLLLYLFSWYWAWMEYRIIFSLANIDSSELRLRKSLVLLLEEVKEDNQFIHINEIKLNKIIIEDSSKTFLTRQVDEDNRKGAYLGYKRVVGMISDILLEINPDYKYPHMLISTLIEGAHNQRYFAEHLPQLTDTVKGEDAIIEFYSKMVFNTIVKE